MLKKIISLFKKEKKEVILTKEELRKYSSIINEFKNGKFIDIAEGEDFFIPEGEQFLIK